MTSRDLEEEFYDWCKEYLPPDSADELSRFLVLATNQYRKYQFVKGLLIGIFLTIIILSWL